MGGQLVNNELEKAWKEAVMAHHSMPLEGKRKTMKKSARKASVSAEIQTRHLPSTCQPVL
jgi:hypothetical protein